MVIPSVSAKSLKFGHTLDAYLIITPSYFGYDLEEARGDCTERASSKNYCLLFFLLPKTLAY